MPLQPHAGRSCQPAAALPLPRLVSPWCLHCSNHRRRHHRRCTWQPPLVHWGRPHVSRYTAATLAGEPGAAVCTHLPAGPIPAACAPPAPARTCTSQHSVIRATNNTAFAVTHASSAAASDAAGGHAHSSAARTWGHGARYRNMLSMRKSCYNDSIAAVLLFVLCFADRVVQCSLVGSQQRSATVPRRANLFEQRFKERYSSHRFMRNRTCRSEIRLRS